MSHSAALKAEKPANPYIGPRAFRAGEQLPARNRECEQLMDLFIPRRIVLLHAPSGVGKSSLINAGLGPAMCAEGFQVISPIRVNEDPAKKMLELLPAEERQLVQGMNFYVRAALLSLEELLFEESDRLPLASLAHFDLPRYYQERLPRKRTEADAGTVPATGFCALIFDQFEEVLTSGPPDRAERHLFFRQLGEVINNPTVWALFSMRDDYVAALDPYRGHIPSRMNTSYQLELLDERGALTAVRKPAETAGIPFSWEAAQALVDDLRRVTATGEQAELALGSYVEPILLQVVCFVLWDRLPSGTTEITLELVRQLVDVDEALGAYYDQSLSALWEVAPGEDSGDALAPDASSTSPARRSQTPVKRLRKLLSQAQSPEDEQTQLRKWIERYLIVETGAGNKLARRRAVPGEGGLPEEIQSRLGPLVNRSHLLRREEWAGTTWYVLAHDRLLRPIVDANGYFRTQQLLIPSRTRPWPSILCTLVWLFVSIYLASALWKTERVIIRPGRPSTPPVRNSK